MPAAAKVAAKPQKCQHGSDSKSEAESTGSDSEEADAASDSDGSKANKQGAENSE